MRPSPHSPMQCPSTSRALLTKALQVAARGRSPDLENAFENGPFAALDRRRIAGGGRQPLGAGFAQALGFLAGVHDGARRRRLLPENQPVHEAFFALDSLG